MTSRPLVLTTAFVTCLWMGLAATAEAQTQTRFPGMDRNNDGQITREEWRGSDRSFQTHDWNNDGVLSGDEVRPGAQRNSNWETADHDPNRFERNISWTESGFSNLDHNRDGRLTTNEWHYDLETFRRIDRDRNNAISRSEFIGAASNDDRGDNFDDLDWNNNGTVERAEWHGGLDEFRWLDRNSDGVLSRFEVAGADNSFDTYDQFQSLDYDRDGAISRAEWHWSRNSFTQRDTNRDGVLSRREFDASGGSPGNAAGVGTLGPRQPDRARQQSAALDRHRHHPARRRCGHAERQRPDSDEQRSRRHGHARRLAARAQGAGCTDPESTGGRLDRQDRRLPADVHRRPHAGDRSGEREAVPRRQRRSPAGQPRRIRRDGGRAIADAVVTIAEPGGTPTPPGSWQRAPHASIIEPCPIP